MFQNCPKFHSSRVKMHRKTAVRERTNRSSSSAPADKTQRINLHKLHPHLTGRGEIPVESRVSLGLGFQGVTSAGPGQKGEEDLSRKVKARTFKDILMSLSESNQVVTLLVDSVHPSIRLSPTERSGCLQRPPASRRRLFSSLQKRLRSQDRAVRTD